MCRCPSRAELYGKGFSYHKPNRRRAGEGGKEKGAEAMTGKEIINLIERLEQEGMTAEKIIDIIKYVEKHDPDKD